MRKLIYIAIIVLGVSCTEELPETKCYECTTVKRMWDYGTLRVDTIKKQMCGLTEDDAYNYEVAETYVINHRPNTMDSLVTKCK